MGIEWLNAMKDALESLGIRTQTGTPVSRAMDIGTTAAAANLTGLDTAQGVMKATVTIITPRRLGALTCQGAAADAAAALAAREGQWSFDGWRYDSAIDCWCVDLTGKRTVERNGNQWAGVEGYQVFVGDTRQELVTDFQASRMMERRLYGGVCQSTAYGVTPAKNGWTVRLTQSLPWDQPEPDEDEPFELTVTRGGVSQVFHECCWSEYISRQTDTGTKLVRVGLAIAREVTENGSD